MELRLKCHQTVDTKSGGWPDVYGRLRWDGQAPTITAGFDSFTRGRYGHPRQDRALTPREAARLQGFPDGFVFSGNRWDVRSQIGNAVPPPLARELGRTIAACLLQSESAEGFPGEESYDNGGTQLGLPLASPKGSYVANKVGRSAASSSLNDFVGTNSTKSGLR